MLKVTVFVLRWVRVLREEDKAELRWLVRSSGEVRVESWWRAVQRDGGDQ